MRWIFPTLNCVSSAKKIAKNIQFVVDISLKISKIIEVTLESLAERFKAPSWKGGVVKATVSSNLMLSAIDNIRPIRDVFCLCLR